MLVIVALDDVGDYDDDVHNDECSEKHGAGLTELQKAGKGLPRKGENEKA